MWNSGPPQDPPIHGKNILNFYFDYLHPSLTSNLLRQFDRICQPVDKSGGGKDMADCLRIAHLNSSGFYISWKFDFNIDILSLIQISK